MCNPCDNWQSLLRQHQGPLHSSHPAGGDQPGGGGESDQHQIIVLQNFTSVTTAVSTVRDSYANFVRLSENLLELLPRATFNTIFISQFSDF